MNNNIVNVKLNDVPNILDEIKNAFFDIPFENSTFQTEAFIISAEMTPERSYRAIGLKMLTSIRTVENYLLSEKELQIDLDEIEYRLQNNNLSDFERRREEVKKEKILLSRSWNEKLLNDLLVELNVLYKHFKKMPKYTREQFESAERLHFEQKLGRQVLGIDGARMSLINMNEDLKSLNKFEDEVEKLGNDINSEVLSRLTLSMENILKGEK